MTASMPRILLVDDEPNVIEGLTRRLRREYQIASASDGVQALRVLEEQGEMDIIVSDMRMPNMNGAALLADVCKLYPDMVRILLTGQTDLEAAIAAVNEGQIFRFLVKPCPTDVLRTQLRAALRQHELIMSERVLLEQTLRGAVQTLTDVLALALPEAFGKATRIRANVRQLAVAVGIQDVWRLEVAATLSQVGAVTLSTETASKLYHGRPLNHDEQAAVERLPAVAVELLRPIPRLEQVCTLITLGFASSTDMPRALEAQALRICAEFDALHRDGVAAADVLSQLQRRGYDQSLLDALNRLVDTESATGRLADVTFMELRDGMILAEDVCSSTGMLILARGHVIKGNVIDRLRSMRTSLGNRQTLRVRVPN